MTDTGFHGLTPNELEMWRAPYHQYIISHNILTSQGTLGIYAAEGSWKSMLALDLMYKVAMGRDWFNFKTTQSPVYYFQTEIPQALLQDRSRKYRLGNQCVTDNCWLATDLYQKIDKGWGASNMEKELARTRPRLLIVDPLNTSIGAKLNEDYDSGLVIDQFNMWRKAYNLAIILIHHDRKSEHSEGVAFHYGTDEWGGSGRWKKWLDTIIYVELVNDGDPIVDLRLTFEKTRHAEEKIAPMIVEADRRNLTIKRKGGI